MRRETLTNIGVLTLDRGPNHNLHILRPIRFKILCQNRDDGEKGNTHQYWHPGTGSWPKSQPVHTEAHQVQDILSE